LVGAPPAEVKASAGVSFSQRQEYPRKSLMAAKLRLLFPECRLAIRDVGAEITRLQQPGNYHRSPGPGLDESSQVLPLDAANAKYRHRRLTKDRSDVFRPDRNVIWLRGRRENGPKADVIRPFRPSGSGLLKAMGGSANDGSRTSRPPGCIQRTVVLPDVNSIRAARCGKVGIIIQDKGHSRRSTPQTHLPSEREDLCLAGLLCAELNYVHACRQERFPHRQRTIRLDVTQIKNAVQARSG
jgi:hypothetical protein